jgi:hypothetical protein
MKAFSELLNEITEYTYTIAMEVSDRKDAEKILKSNGVKYKAMLDKKGRFVVRFKAEKYFDEFIKNELAKKDINAVSL